jgi:hypothetical protein
MPPHAASARHPRGKDAAVQRGRIGGVTNPRAGPARIALAGLMQIVPAHDRNAYDGIPRLPAQLAPAPAPKAAEQPR